MAEVMGEYKQYYYEYDNLINKILAALGELELREVKSSTLKTWTR